MGPVNTQIGTQFSLTSEVSADAHISVSGAAPAVQAPTTQVLTPFPSDHQDMEEEEGFPRDEELSPNFDEEDMPMESAEE
eukprot:330117-Amphidinium_carterae.1